MITLKKELDGKILDIGGGGECIIGRLYGEQVVAIDNRQEELDEAPAVCEKVLMDATDLNFPDCSFDYVTSFYSLMFMCAEDQRKAITEISRVLKRGGEIHIWDCDIVSAYPEPFCIDLEIQLPEAHITTTYGVGKLDAQDGDSIKQMALDAGLLLKLENTGNDGFYLQFQKGSKEYGAT